MSEETEETQKLLTQALIKLCKISVKHIRETLEIDVDSCESWKLKTSVGIFNEEIKKHQMFNLEVEIKVQDENE